MPYTATSLADLKVLMAQRWDSSVFWTGEEARLALNESLRDWNLLTGRWRRRVALSSLAATPEITLPATMTYGMRVRMATGAPLHPTSILELDLGRPTWRTETTATGGDVPTAPLLWAPLSLLTIVIWPPTVGAGASNLEADGVSDTPILLQDADTIDLGEEIVDYIVDFAIHIAAFKEAGPRWRATRVFFTAFLEAAAQENGLLKTNQAYRRFAGLDRRRDMQKTKDIPNQIDQTLKLLQDSAGSEGGTS